MIRLCYITLQYMLLYHVMSCLHAHCDSTATSLAAHGVTAYIIIITIIIIINVCIYIYIYTYVFFFFSLTNIFRK